MVYYLYIDGLISQKCLACGNKDSVDMTHKLTAFILAQHKKAKELRYNFLLYLRLISCIY